MGLAVTYWVFRLPEVWLCQFNSRWQTHALCIPAWWTKLSSMTTAIVSLCEVTCARFSYAALGRITMGG